MTRQETFDLAAKHLLTQNVRSEGDIIVNGRKAPTPGCRYRGPNGTKCAIGALIPDKYYEPNLEGLACDVYPVSNTLRALGHDVELCRKLQLVHDARAPWTWGYNLRILAEEYDLEYKEERYGAITGSPTA
jgi:hypothetical protein